MNFRFTIVETSLNRAEFRWKWMRFLRISFVLGVLASSVVFLLGAAVLLGWVTSKTLVLTCFSALGVVGFIAWVIVMITVFAGVPDRGWLAATLERVDRRLLDRLNTLLFLETRRGQARTEAFALRIARQTQSVLAEKPSPPPFSSRSAFGWFVAFIIAVALTSSLYYFAAPWPRLLAAGEARETAPAEPDKPLELAPPATNSLEQNLSWGEVRITDPGADLKVTKVDVVPLQIEAAANQSLKKVSWYSTVNSAGEQAHELPPPSEPRYAVYQPAVYLDELQLSDWDVMTYFARASTEKENSFASEIYFLEVRPFREDILKLPGGEQGRAYQCLNQLSGLINRQQHVIRQTHQHIQKPPEQENLQQQDRRKLSEAESDLGQSAQHLYAQMASDLENKPIGEALDNLAKAEKSLSRASQLLQDNIMNEAPNRERSALSELVAARKAFQKSISENPNAFEEREKEEATPLADATKKLEQIAEFRNESKAAQEFVRKALVDQKDISQQARSAQRGEYPRLAEQESRLEKSLEDFQRQHPKAFQGIEADSQAAQQAMTRATESLEHKSSDSRTTTQQATQLLQKLDDVLQSQSAGQQLADAYRLKQMLDQQIQTFDKYSKGDSNVSGADASLTAEQARQALNQLKKVAEQEPTRDAFGQALRDSLNGRNKVDLDAKLSQVQQAQDETSRQQRAGEAKEGLTKVSQAFSQSEPRSLQMAQKSDALKPGDQDSFSTGMAQIGSLIRRLEENRQPSREDQARQQQEALSNLEDGMRAQYGDNERGQLLLSAMKDMLKVDTPIQLDKLKKLMEELQHFSVEASDHLARTQDKPEMTNIDPARLPPAYRGRIQKYFQRLSEK